MTDDLVYRLSASVSSQSFFMNDEILQHVLLELQKILKSATPSTSLKDYGLPMPSQSLLAILRNRLLLEETSYDRVSLQNKHADMVSKINPDQLLIYNFVRASHENQKHILLFIYGHGGTGKTFLWSTILAYIRSTGKIALAVAALGIASLLLPSGRMAHSCFNSPIELTDTSMCNITKKTQFADLLKQTSIVIWDEAPMTDRHYFECVDQTFRDILDCGNPPFGGISMLLGGDFRQTLPIKPKSSAYDIIASTLLHSYLWRYFKVHKLYHSMCLSANDRANTSNESSIEFASWLLDVGNGDLGVPDPSDTHHTSFIEIPDTLLINNSDDCLKTLIRFVYEPHILANPSASNLSTRAIVCPKNETAENINALVLEMTDDSPTLYLSTDSMIPHTQQTTDISVPHKNI